MSKWPDRRVSLPQDQPTRYLAAGLVRDSIAYQFESVDSRAQAGRT